MLHKSLENAAGVLKSSSNWSDFTGFFLGDVCVSRVSTWKLRRSTFPVEEGSCHVHNYNNKFLGGSAKHWIFTV